LQSPISLNIHNQCQDINLISPVYFVDGGKWHVAPDQKIDAHAIMRNCIEFDSEQDILKGALVYKMQRKRTESDKSAQDKSRRIQLLVAWHVEPTKELNVRALLIEHDSELNEDKLRKLHQKYWHLLNTRFGFIRNHRLSDEATILTTMSKAMNGGYRWDIFTFKKEKDKYAMEPLWTNSER
jgi:hypothetical protein